MSPLPSNMLALNEPESSIHPDLLAPLAELIFIASRRSQIWVITHSFALAELSAERCQVEPTELEKIGGITKIKGRNLVPD